MSSFKHITKKFDKDRSLTFPLRKFALRDRILIDADLRLDGRQ